MPKSESGPVVWEKVDKELVGDPVDVGAWTVTPVARLRGTQGSGGDGVNGGGGARLRLDPVAVTIVETEAAPENDLTDGSLQRVEIQGGSTGALRGMAVAGLLVAGISLLVQFWAGSRRKKK